MKPTCLDCNVAIADGARCEECLAEVLETPMWAGVKTRLASCGHPVPSHQGRSRRHCPPCAAAPPPVVSRPKRQGSCEQCGESFASHSAVKKFCTSRCGEIARGQRLPEALTERQCALPTCGATFQPKSRKQRCCSEQHGKNLYNRESRADGRQAINSGDPAKRRARLRIRTQMRRARTKTNEAEKVDRDVVGERDGWKCGVCRRKVNRALAYPHPKSPSLDHVIPLADHGPHTYANCRIAHLDCNNLRSNRGGNEQLALVG